MFDVEPLPDGHRLRSMDNVVATPHIGYVADVVYRTFYGEAAAAIATVAESWRGTADCLRRCAATPGGR